MPSRRSKRSTPNAESSWSRSKYSVTGTRIPLALAIRPYIASTAHTSLCSCCAGNFTSIGLPASSSELDMRLLLRSKFTRTFRSSTVRRTTHQHSLRNSTFTLIIHHVTNIPCEIQQLHVCRRQCLSIGRFKDECAHRSVSNERQPVQRRELTSFFPACERACPSTTCPNRPATHHLSVQAIEADVRKITEIFRA